MRPAEGWASGHKAGKRSLEAAQTCIVPLRPWGRSWMAVAELPQDGKALPPWDRAEATPQGRALHTVSSFHTPALWQDAWTSPLSFAIIMRMPGAWCFR